MKIKGKTIHLDRFGKIDLVKMLSDINNVLSAKPGKTYAICCPFIKEDAYPTFHHRGCIVCCSQADIGGIHL